MPIIHRYRSAYSTLYLIDVRLLVLEVYYSWYNLKKNMSKVYKGGFKAASGKISRVF